MPERFASAYPDEDVTAYVAAFLDPKLVVLMEDALPKPPFPAVKPAVRELAEKIRDSGGWKLVRWDDMVLTRFWPESRCEKLPTTLERLL